MWFFALLNPVDRTYVRVNATQELFQWQLS
jgi:hypothetical protein